MLVLARMVNEFVYCPRRFKILVSQEGSSGFGGAGG